MHSSEHTISLSSTSIYEVPRAVSMPLHIKMKRAMDRQLVTKRTKMGPDVDIEVVPGMRRSLLELPNEVRKDSMLT
jgi:hypothetical protein